jgi:organic radical activating enzyme
VATPAGTERHAGWATPARACEWVAAAEPGVPRTISVTGGEPLLWPGFVRALRAAAGGRRVHLETAGAHPEALAEVLASVDHVSLDLKLPADLEEPVPVPEAEGAVPHGEFAWAAVRARTLDLLRGRDACLKLLVAGGRRAQAFTPLLDEVRARAPELPLFVQPVTPANGVRAPDPATLVEVAELARARGLAVRVVPQIHRLLGVP